MNRQKTTVPGDGEIAGSNAKETPKEGLDHASHEYRRRKALAELAHLGIPVIRYDPTTSDVPLPLKIEGGSVRTDFDPATPLARGHVVDVSDIRHSPQDHNPTTTTRGKLFLQLTMRDEDQRRLFSKYPQRNYIPIHEDFQMILEYQSSLDLISIGMHDYNPDDTHLWPGVPHSYLYAPPGSPYDPDKPPVVKGDGFPYIQRGHLTLARREVPMTDLQYERLVEKVESLEGSGIIKLRYDMGDGIVESVVFAEIWIKINPQDDEPTRILKKVALG